MGVFLEIRFHNRKTEKERKIDLHGVVSFWSKYMLIIVKDEFCVRFCLVRIIVVSSLTEPL